MMKRVMNEKWIRRVSALVLAGVIAVGGAAVDGRDVSRVQAVTRDDVSGNEAATDEEIERARSELSTYANNLIVKHNLTGSLKEEIESILKKARKKIKEKYADDFTAMAEYVENVKSQMDAVVAGIPSSTSEFIALADNYSTQTVKHGETVMIVLPVVNYSGAELSDVVVKPQISNLVSEWPFVPNSSGATKTIKSFPAYYNENDIQAMRQDIGFSFVVRSDVKSGYYPLKFDFTYSRNNTVETATITTYVKAIGTAESGSLDEEKEDDEEKSKPRIIVTGFETYPAQIYAGDTFTLTIHVKNTSKSAAVTNVLFDMQAKEEGKEEDNKFAAFLPTSGASSVYVDSIAPEGSTDLVIEMSAKSDLAQKPYVLDVNMKYDSKEAMDLSDTASVSIPIYQEQRCETGDAEVNPSDITVGGQANIMFDVYNTGKTTLYNVWVKFKGDSISGGDTFLGTITPGGTGSVDAMLTGAAATMDDGTIKAEISYENESGVITTIEKDLTLYVMEEMMGGDMMDPMGEGEMMDMDEMEGAGSGMPKWLTPLVALSVIVIVILVVVLIRRRKRKKAAAELDDFGFLDSDGKN